MCAKSTADVDFLVSSLFSKTEENAVLLCKNKFKQKRTTGYFFVSDQVCFSPQQLLTFVLTQITILAQKKDGEDMFEVLEILSANNNGILTTESALKAGVSKYMLSKFVAEKQYERVFHGIYLAPDAWRDEAYLTQLRCPQVIISHNCALFYHDLTDREPTQITVTTKNGYNPTHLSSDGVKVYTVKSSLHTVGVTQLTTSFGNMIRVYDMERTICDIVRSRSTIESQTYHDALRLYARKKEKNLFHLMEYASLFHVEKIIREYMEVLL